MVAGSALRLNVKSILLTGSPPRCVLLTHFITALFFSSKRFLGVSEGWTLTVIGFIHCQQIILSKAVNQFFGFILLVFKLCRDGSVGREVRLARCFR